MQVGRARSPPSNGKMRRLNGTIRNRGKTFRGLGAVDITAFDGLKVYHNHVRKHDAIKNQTPAEAAGTATEGRNRWKALIRNSGLRLIAANQRAQFHELGV